MKTRTLIGSVCLLALAGCGLEGLLFNVRHRQYEMPASTIRGVIPWAGGAKVQLTVIDGDGNEIAPFASKLEDGRYELRLPSSRYSMLRVRARSGNVDARALVPFLGEESAIDGVNLDARAIAEDLIVEARLSADQKTLRLLTPAAYLGDGRTTGARTMIRADFDADVATSTQDLLHMVERVMVQADPFSGALNPTFFAQPVFSPEWAVTTSALDGEFLKDHGFDYDGQPGVETTTTPFDRLLAAVAQTARFDPSGCNDPSHVRLVFSVDFNEGAQNGNCGSINRFKWAKDAPGKKMFFVGWIHRESVVQDPAINALLGASTPNQIPMYDDGTNGDEIAGDNVFTVYFDVPFDPARPLRIGYKYTWGFRGAPWTGSEEWPGNSRIIEVRDVNKDGFVHRRDVFGDEATNKDASNLNLTGSGTVTWDTVLLGAPAGCMDLGDPTAVPPVQPAPIPEAREQPSTIHSACRCGTWFTPRSIGPLKVACGP